MVDSHTHIDSEEFDGDRAEVLARARAAGVTLMVDPGCDVPSSERAVALAEAHEDVYAAVGIHPHTAREASPAAFDTLRRLAAHPRVVAVGETGLDYHYDFSPRDQQRESLAMHVALAHEVGLPMVLHCRNAEEDLIAILERLDGARCGGVVHCFTGPAAVAMRLVALGFYIGVTGIVTFKKAVDVQETARQVPVERLLVETDAPYLAPIPYRGKRNEPAYVAETVRCIAGLRGMSVEALAEATAANARRLFRL